MKSKYEETIRLLSDKELRFHLYLTQVFLLFIALVIGLFLFHSWDSFFALFQWDGPSIAIGILSGLVIVMLDIIGMRVLPPSYYNDGGVNIRIFSSLSPAHIVVITLIIAFSEEVLFRGVLQTHFGLIVTSLIFALVHYRYLFQWFLFLNVVLLSFFIGWIYELTGNLLATIIMHFIIDCLLGLYIYISQRAGREDR
ncbi:CPBP family intramembrane glutamic endopeptidase [Cytobacillus sp. FSL K6-0129]|uniref:CPBP family intramembrane glutamic endopeptidase n=1 Tax=Cytobacillus sp. FSL K6-0129 TaxID=2921421 RepID=UPI0030F8A7EA